MNAKEIQRSLIRDRYRRSFVIPNYTPKGWWECDLFELTEAGYFNEYEVKLTVADFYADRKKCQSVPDGPATLKWDRLREGKGPSRFWFVLPSTLINAVAIPPFAGLIAVKSNGGARLFAHELKQAPRLHRNKADLKIREHAAGVCYWRMHNLILKRA